MIPMATKPRIYLRKDWGARHGSGFGVRALPVRGDILHQSYTPEPTGGTKATYKADVAAVRTLENIGQSRFGRGISYNYVITPSGRIFEGIPVGRIGAHSAGYNTTHIGIVLVGNFSKKQPSAQALSSLLKLRRWLKSDKKMRNVKIIGHRDTKATACPGAAAYKLVPDINTFKRDMKRGMRGADVKRAQQRYVFHGFATWKSPGGFFGTGTIDATKRYQKAKYDKVTSPVTIGTRTYADLIRK